MSFLFRNPKKQEVGNNQKVLDDNKNREFFPKFISNKKCNEMDLSKLYTKLKEYKIFSPRYQTLKNSRNKILFILFFLLYSNSIK